MAQEFNWFKSLIVGADELVDHFSVRKIDVLTEVGKRILPEGYWGGPDHDSADGANVLYMTFDDGPNPHTTPQLLELLEQENVQGTFFLIGANAERYPELVERISAAGHTIGNHTYSHSWMPTMHTKDIEREIGRTNAVISDVTGVQPGLFRPPYGVMDQRAADCLKERNMKPVYWGAAPEDWSIPGTHRVIRRVMWRIAPGTLIVLHEGKWLRKQTIAAAKEIIYKCKDLGFRLAKVNVRA